MSETNSSYFPISQGNITTGDQTFTGIKTFASTTTLAESTHVGSGGPANTAVSLFVGNPTSGYTGTIQDGLKLTLAGSSLGTGSLFGIRISSLGSATAAYTVTNVTGLSIPNIAKGGGSTITSAFGAKITGQSNGSTNNVTLAVSESTTNNNTNLLIGTLTAPTGSYSIYNSSTKENFLGGPLTVNSGTITATAMPEYANRTAALAGGLTAGKMYSLPIVGDNKIVCIV